MRSSLFRILRIARRDYLAAVLTKGFLVGLVLAPLLMCGGLVAIPMMRHVDAVDRRVLVLDGTGSLGEVLVAAAEQRSREMAGGAAARGGRILLELALPAAGGIEAQRLSLADRVRAGDLQAFAEIGAGVLDPAGNSGDAWIRYYAKGSMLDDARAWLDRVINEELRRRRLVGAGLDPVRVGALTRRVPVEGMTLPQRDRSTGVVQASRRESGVAELGIPFGAVMLMMMMVLMGSLPLLQGVVEEKSQRIAEVLLGCAGPGEIMAGKLLGGVGVAMTGMVFYLGMGVPTLVAVAGMAGVPFGLLPWLVAYMAGAVLMYGSLAVALGAACSDMKDAQHLQMPVMLPLIIPMMLLMPVLKEPNSLFATVFSLIPPFTPLVMVLRLSSPAGVPGWQPWAGLAGVAVSTVAVLWLAGRIFRVGILMQGKPPRLMEILRWGWRG